VIPEEYYGNCSNAGFLDSFHVSFGMIVIMRRARTLRDRTMSPAQLTRWNQEEAAGSWTPGCRCFWPNLVLSARIGFGCTYVSNFDFVALDCRRETFLGEEEFYRVS
jgi:hypothetical protein